jgi:hypothetical protein
VRTLWKNRFLGIDNLFSGFFHLPKKAGWSFLPKGISLRAHRGTTLRISGFAQFIAHSFRHSFPLIGPERTGRKTLLVE